MAQRVSESALHLMFARQFWQEIEVLARNRKERPLHAFAKKAVKQLGIEMIDLAKEEIFNDGDDDEEMSREEARRLLKEESEMSDVEKLERDAMMNAFIEKELEERGW
jgi:hypothetical protein